MTASRFTVDQLMHGDDYSGQECAGWLAQRKWDGWSATWDGERLWTKPSPEHPHGNVIPAPACFTEGLPDFPLCCELVAGKEGANHVQSLVRNFRNAAEWERATLYIFDAPQSEGCNSEDRLCTAALHTPRLLDERHHFEFTRTTELRDRAHLRELLRTTLDAGGEGLMIQPPENPYVAGRTRRLLKVKRQSLHFLRNA